MKKTNTNKRVVLVAGLGTSPAVLTETVWALAHGENPVVPSQVVVITTASGKRCLQSELLSGERSVWSQMTAALVKEKIPGAAELKLGATDIKVLPDADNNEADDLRSAADNMRAADFMLGEIRKFTEEPDTIVYTSIAGGRKTMSALMLSCMSLLGRDEDKVFHVLTTPEPIGFSPKYYYPQKGVSHSYKENGNPKTIPSSKVKVELFEVPFVKVRGLFQEKYKRTSPRYSVLVNAVQRLTPPAELPRPIIRLDVDTGIVSVGEMSSQINECEFAVLFVMAHGIVKAEDIFDCLIGACQRRIADVTKLPTWFVEFRESKRMNDKENGLKPEASLVGKVCSKLRGSPAVIGTLKKIGLDDASAKMLVPKGGKAMSYPRDKIIFEGKKWLSEIRGYLLPPEMR